MAASVADFRPREVATSKIKKTHQEDPAHAPDESAPVIELVRNPDILAGLVRDRARSARRLGRAPRGGSQPRSRAAPRKPTASSRKCATTRGITRPVRR